MVSSLFQIRHALQLIGPTESFVASVLAGFQTGEEKPYLGFHFLSNLDLLNPSFFPPKYEEICKCWLIHQR